VESACRRTTLFWRPRRPSPPSGPARVGRSSPAQPRVMAEWNSVRAGRWPATNTTGPSACMTDSLRIRRLDSRQDDLRLRLAELRRQLSPRGEVVSEAGRRRTVQAFGEAPA